MRFAERRYTAAVASEQHLGKHFLAHIDEGHRGLFGAASELGSVLAHALDGAQRRWSGVAIKAQDFVAYLAERADIEEDYAAIPAHTSDLYLAMGCLLGDADALAHFERDVLSKVAPVLARLRLSPSQADEVRQELRVRLFVDAGSRQAVLASYLGSGSLTHWVQAVAGRQALTSLRRNRAVSPVEDDLLFELFDDPVEAELKERYRAAFKEALHEAVQGLEARETMIMRALIIERRGVAEVARVFGVHRVTASRWIARIRRKLYVRTRAGVRASLELSERELESMMRLIESQMEMSLARVLEEPA